MARHLNPNARTVSIPYFRKFIVERQGGNCAIGIPRGRGVKCLMGGKLDRRLVEIDHIREYADGGLTVLDNLQALCPLCHKRKTKIVRINRTILRRFSF